MNNRFEKPSQKLTETRKPATNGGFPTPFRMAYVEVNEHNITNVAAYKNQDNNENYFDVVSIFAANIHGSDPNKPTIHFNPQVDQILNHSSDISFLQKNNIKVLLTLMGDHQNAGWSCLTSDEGIKNFANDIVMVVNKYHLDGIDIDDEYSNCKKDATSLLKLAAAIKAHPQFKGKLLTKALFVDFRYFSVKIDGKRLGDFLDYAWDMNYGSPKLESRLSQYLALGMQKDKLAIGLRDAWTPKLEKSVEFVKQENCGGLMFFNVRNNSQIFLPGAVKAVPASASPSINVGASLNHHFNASSNLALALVLGKMAENLYEFSSSIVSGVSNYLFQSVVSRFSEEKPSDINVEHADSKQKDLENQRDLLHKRCLAHSANTLNKKLQVVLEDIAANIQETSGAELTQEALASLEEDINFALKDFAGVNLGEMSAVFFARMQDSTIVLDTKIEDENATRLVGIAPHQ